MLIVGGYYGNGRSRAGFLSHFLLAVADHTTMPEDGSEPADVNATKWYEKERTCVTLKGMFAVAIEVGVLLAYNERRKRHCYCEAELSVLVLRA